MRSSDIGCNNFDKKMCGIKITECCIEISYKFVSKKMSQKLFGVNKILKFYYIIWSIILIYNIIYNNSILYI